MKFIAIFIMLIFSCTNLIHTKSPLIHRYTRNSGSDNGYLVYSDDVIIENYRDRTITIDSFVKLAFKYMDTVKADHPVVSVTFIGKNDNTDLPSPRADDYLTVSDYYRKKTIYLAKNAFSNNFTLFLTLGHEIVHVMHYNSNLVDKYNLFEFKGGTEWAAYGWEISAFKANGGSYYHTTQIHQDVYKDMSKKIKEDFEKVARKLNNVYKK